MEKKSIAKLLESDLPLTRLLCAYFDGIGTRFSFSGEELTSERVFSKFGFLPALDYIVKSRSQVLGDIFDSPPLQTNSSGLMGYRLGISEDSDVEDPSYKYMMLQAAEDLFFEESAKRDTLVNLNPIYEMFMCSSLEDKQKWVSEKL